LESVEDGGDALRVCWGLFAGHNHAINLGKVFRCDRC
jgi:hypothetical protein